ncbi:MAG: substrate-binding domain-containing protein [Eubacteriales bacterium]|jgi:ribose transport system substrate-binding protein|nr:substrate-binding domain-containing protein [Oscillospiraceae bacterium]MBQ1578625.1 substrate-binding domain-containing protein [Oscillospiraceae bacterium]MBQ1790586.1 substrate-binding domain-containing protein [Oscillospiraceae bacterium]MBQ2072116.1 substrate-binding domain-containing protein [Oscillospiraceae bacterium]MBQ2597709.1 substrate-binding domain-containing protein [Oscillospiraceae bacterium]
MKNAKLRISAMLLLLAALLLSACGHTEGRAAQYKIYLITKSTSTEFWRSVFAGANAARAEYNVNLVIRGPDTEENYAGQNMYIQEAVRNHADAIVFSAISYTENAAAIDEAAEAGIKIVVIDSDVNSSRVSARIGTDNMQAGRITAAAALDTDEQHLSVGIVNFAQFSRNGEEREIGLREQLEKDPRVEEICTVNSLTDHDAARESATELLREHPEINILIGLNEPLGVGVAEASEELKLKDRVRVISFDSNIRCIELLRHGDVSALIVQNPYAMGYLGVETAWKILEGQSFRPDQLIDTATSIITQENMFSVEGQKALFSFG